MEEKEPRFKISRTWSRDLRLAMLFAGGYKICVYCIMLAYGMGMVMVIYHLFCPPSSPSYSAHQKDRVSHVS